MKEALKILGLDAPLSRKILDYQNDPEKELFQRDW